MDKFLLDTSAIFTFSLKEEGVDKVARILELSRHKEAINYVSFVSLMELYYITWQRLGEDRANELINDVKALPIEIFYPYERLILSAGRIKATYKLSIADSIIAASAEELKAVLVHKDPELEKIKEIEQIALPYKR